MDRAMAGLNDPTVSQLITVLKEKPRATRYANREYIDTGNNLELICLPRHTVVFGRRGSGKTMLLSELEGNAKANGHGVIWIDIDTYKSLTFPDILIQVLRCLFHALLRDVARCNRVYRPLRYWNTRSVRKELLQEEGFLNQLLERFEESELVIERNNNEKSNYSRNSTLKASKGLSTGLAESHGSERSSGLSESATGTDRKIDRISRHLHDAKGLLERACSRAHGTYYLVLDDFYHLDTGDQAQVLDYLQSLTKNLDVHIKFGTIAHRSNLYRRGDRLIQGLQKEHDVLPIDLDRTFQNFTEVENFIRALWNQIKLKVPGAEFDSLFSENSWRQLILASGGSPRDFMNILARALELGRSRAKDKLDVFLVNEAANLYLRETKHDDLISDKSDQTGEIEQMLLDIRRFCTNDRKRNLFLVSKDDLEAKHHQVEMLRQLLDYRFIHLVHTNTSAAGKDGRYAAYMLDVGLYAHPQRRGENRIRQVNFLERDDEHRADAIRTQPVYVLKEHYGAIGKGSPFDPPEEDPPPTTESVPESKVEEVEEKVQRLLQF
jgi:Cdc6-like AAA superfamily ATPase